MKHNIAAEHFKYPLRRSLLWLVPLYFALVSVTDAHFMADMADYADSVVQRLGGTDYHFWEFSHLLWRPLGFVWMRLGGASLGVTFAGGAKPEAVVAYAYVLTNVLLGALSVAALRAWTEEFGVRERWANFVCVSFICAHAFLNFAQAGTSYAAGLSFLLLGFYFATRRSRKARTSVLAGVYLACAVCLWITYLWALPAAFLAPLVLGVSNCSDARQREWRARFRDVLLTATVTALCGAIIYGAALWLAVGARSPADAVAWIRSSPSLGVTETKGALRMVFGLARSFIYMGNDGLIVKRFLVGDPFNPVTLFDLLRLSLWKFALFYLFFAALVVGLWMHRRSDTTTGRRVLLLVALNAAPVLFFATNFDGGAVERYLPLYPTVFFAAAYLLGARADFTTLHAASAIKNEEVVSAKWQTVARRSLFLSRWTVVAFFIVAACVNVWAMSLVRLRAEQQRIAGRAEELAARLKPESRVFAVNWQDELINFSRSFPFHALNARGSFRLQAVVTPGTIQTAIWRADFARLAFETWDAGGDVWISRRAFAARPEADWNWVEGDDSRVRWRDFPTFFGGFATDGQAGGHDGFVRLARTEGNEALLRAELNRRAQ